MRLTKIINDDMGDPRYNIPDAAKSYKHALPCNNTASNVRFPWKHNYDTAFFVYYRRVQSDSARTRLAALKCCLGRQCTSFLDIAPVAGLGPGLFCVYV